jgi:hypothetical protein
MGGNLRVMAVLLAVVFSDFSVMGTILFPGKAHSVLIVDPDAVLARAVSLQGFQSIAGGIGRSVRARALLSANKRRRAASSIFANSLTASRLNKRSVFLQENVRIKH